MQNVGCDGIIDSKMTFDSCGVCGGDSNTCYRVHEVFEQYASGEQGGLSYTSSSYVAFCGLYAFFFIVNEYDYNKIHTIEVGGSNIVIKDYSRNYLGKIKHDQPTKPVS